MKNCMTPRYSTCFAMEVPKSFSCVAELSSRDFSELTDVLHKAMQQFFFSKFTSHFAERYCLIKSKRHSTLASGSDAISD